MSECDKGEVRRAEALAHRGCIRSPFSIPAFRCGGGERAGAGKENAARQKCGNMRLLHVQRMRASWISIGFLTLVSSFLLQTRVVAGCWLGAAETRDRNLLQEGWSASTQISARKRVRSLKMIKCGEPHR